MWLKRRLACSYDVGILICMPTLWMDLCHSPLLWLNVTASHLCVKTLLQDADEINARRAWTYIALTVTRVEEANESYQFS